MTGMRPSRAPQLAAPAESRRQGVDDDRSDDRRPRPADDVAGGQDPRPCPEGARLQAPHPVPAGLGIYLVVLPLVRVHVSAFAELVGGNYTNVTSDLGASIAAGGTLHLLRQHRQHREELRKLHEMVRDLHARSQGTA